MKMILPPRECHARAHLTERAIPLAMITRYNDLRRGFRQTVGIWTYIVCYGKSIQQNFDRTRMHALHERGAAMARSYMP